LAAPSFIFRSIFVATSLQPERKKSANDYVVPTDSACLYAE
jgi:hypothetical protein